MLAFASRQVTLLEIWEGQPRYHFANRECTVSTKCLCDRENPTTKFESARQGYLKQTKNAPMRHTLLLSPPQ